MAILASVIVAQAATILQDSTNVRWSAAELLGWLNVARRAGAALRPSMFVTTAVVTLAAGAKQAVPATGHVLLRLHTNMGTDGTTVGTAIYPASRDHLDFQQPNWRKATARDAVECYMYDPSTPLQFYVSPPNTGAGKVEMSYGAVPADILSTDPIGCPDVYQGALLDYVLFRAFSKPTQGGSAEDAVRAAGHFTAFQAALVPKAAE